MARGKAHSEETKAAVMAALLAGQSISQVARDYKLSKSLVSGWKNSAPVEQFEQVRTQKSERIEGLLFAYLEANLTALRAQMAVAGDEAYLRKFPPQQLAVLHGVIADKGIRLLEALSGAGEPGPEATGTEDSAAAHEGAEGGDGTVSH